MTSKRHKSTPQPKETARVPVSPKPTPQPAHNNERIGDILRRVREHRNEDLQSVSDYLCIRQAYLFAMEESHYDDLPAEAYVIGFLRSYASYLGLDGQGAIEQYRREMAGRRRAPNLSMPQPMAEGRAPTVALLAGAAVAAIIIYGLWYGLSTPEDAITKQPIQLPQVTKEITSTPTSLKTSSAEEQSEEEAAATLLQETTSPGITLSVTGVDETALPPEAAKKLGELAIAPTDDKTNKAEKKAIGTEEPKAKEEKEEKSVFGTKRKSRVTIEAIKKTWILVTDKKGLTVFDRTLKVGQKYKVRLNKNLRLTTGNAKGLRFIVDGKPLPKLKTDKRVIRAINLSPKQLKDRLD